MKSKISAIIILFICFPSFARNEIKVVSSDRNSIVIEYTPQYSDTSHIKINNEEFIRIDLNEGFYPSSGEWGMPAVLKRSVNVGVPSEFGNTIKVLNYSTKEIKGKLIPKPKMVRNKGLDNYVYEVNSSYNSYEDKDELVSFGEYGIARGIPVQTIIISPIFYTPGTIKIYTRIVFQINFTSTQKTSAIAGDNFFSEGIINYNIARYWRRESNYSGSNRLRKSAALNNSVLSTGKWTKFECPEEGIYRITSSMLSSFGIDAGTVDPRTIKIYNNGGKMLPEDMDAPYPTDLKENAIYVFGEEDGKFDEGDYILFYGRGTDFWDYDSTQKKISRYFNLYSKQNYYFITSGGVTGKRMQQKLGLQDSHAYVQKYTQAFKDRDVDTINIFSSGRYFVGDGFSSNNVSYSYANKLEGRVTNTPVNYSFRIVNILPSNITLEVFENSTRIFFQSLAGTSIMGGVQDYSHGIEYNYTASYNNNLPDDNSLLKFQVNSSSSGTSAYLDFFEINYQKELKAFNDNIVFFSKDTSSIIEYDLSNFSNSNIMVFDASDYANLKIISNPILLSGGDFNFQANEESGKVSKYVAVGNDQFKAPINPVEVGNQNLHGITDGAKYIIISNKAFIDQANTLKKFRESEAKEKLSSIVVDVDQIYNEFSGGALDVSGIRNFIKYAYDNWSIKPEYVLLFGDGSYDYKNIEGNNNNFIPAFENYDTSLFPLNEAKYNEIYSFPMDDYYVMVDGNDKMIDLAIGRLTVQSADDAQIAVDKIMDYEKNTDKNLWRNLITVVADDGLAGVGVDEGALHTSQAEDLSNNIIPGSFDINKIYLAQYPAVITGVGRTKPQVNEAIIAAMNQGTLIVHYVGHGNEHVWAHETVFENSSSIPRLHNSRYFFLTVASCQFGYYDKGTIQSGAELLLLKENGGAIGVFSATRPVYSDQNAALNQTFYNYLLNSKRDSLNLPITVGKAYLFTKDAHYAANDEKFALLSDPALQLLIPEYESDIDSINGQSLVISKSGNSNSTAAIEDTVQIKALSNASIHGVIKRPDNTVWDDFNGEGIITVYDSERKVKLEQLNGYQMSLQGGTLFRGRVSITNGHFTSNFIVPKDISYQNENGKIIVYFFNNEADGLGYTNNIIVGGVDSSTVNDGKGPNIEIYFDVASSNSSNLITPDSKLIVKLSDETGINTTGTGVGHDLEGILNDNISNPVDFTNYFTSDLNSNGKSGQINYPFNDISTGDYKMEIKAWDVFNNYSTKTAYFTVVGSDKLMISDVYNYPNPFSNKTTFTFQANLNTLLDLKIKIYTIAGRLIKEIEENNKSGYVMVPWDGRDEDGNLIANGTYFYKLIVNTIDGKYNTNVIGKLAVIR